MFWIILLPVPALPVTSRKTAIPDCQSPGSQPCFGSRSGDAAISSVPSTVWWRKRRIWRRGAIYIDDSRMLQWRRPIFTMPSIWPSSDLNAICCCCHVAGLRQFDRFKAVRHTAGTAVAVINCYISQICSGRKSWCCKSRQFSLRLPVWKEQ